MQRDDSTVFRFTYTVFNVMARLEGDRLQVQMGIRQIDIHLDRLQHLFVDDRKSRESVELILSYVTKSGKLKRSRIFSDHGEAGFAAFVEAILERRPEIDIRGVDVSTAYERMGSRSLEWFAIPLVMFVGLVIVAVVCTPMLIHGLDTERTTIDITSTSTQPATRTVRILGGRLILQSAVTDTRATAGGDENASVWIPLVPPKWTEGDEVRVVVQVLGKHLGKLQPGEAVEGLLRDVWWEGLDARRRREFKQGGVRTAHDAWLVDASATPRDDLGIAVLILGVLGTIFAGVTLTLILRRPRRRRS